MSNPNVRPSDRVAVLGVIDPQSATTAKSTGWVDAGLYESLLAIIKVGVLGSSTTVNAKLEQATSVAGAGAKDVTAKAITQLTQAGTDDSKQVLINLKSEDLDVNNRFQFVRLTVTPAVSTALLDAVLLGLDARYGGSHVATVDEVV